MKKTALVLTIILVAALCATMLSSCYVSRPAAMKKVVGTYELTSFTRTYSAAEGETESNTVDMIKDKEIKAYLVVNADGKGYYVYSDKDTEVTTHQVNITFTYDEDDSSKVKEIYYTDGADASGDGSPLKGHEHLGVYFKWTTKKLTYSMPAVLGRKYSQSVRYDRVDKATDLSYVSKKFGKTLVAPAYEVAQLDGLLTYEGIYDMNSPYVYYYMDYRPAQNKATVYYMLKADEIQKTQDVTATFTVNATVADGYTQGSIDFMFGNVAMTSAYYGTPVTSLVCQGEDYEMYFYHYRRGTSNIAELIANAVNMYNEYKSNE